MPSAAPRAGIRREPHPMAREAVAAIEALLGDATRKLRARVIDSGTGASRELFDSEQRATHGLAWLATYVEAIRAARRLRGTPQRSARLGEDRRTARPHRHRRISRADLRRHRHVAGRDRPAGRSRADAADVASRWTPALDGLIASGNTARNRARLVELCASSRPASSAIAGSTKRWNTCARRCAASPTARSCRTRTTGISATLCPRRHHRSRCANSACSA